jgi:Tol biopolymer transport system component
MRSTTLILPALLAGAAAFAAGCGGSDAPNTEAAARQAPPELPGGRIAFRRYLDDAHTQGALFTINPDGTDEKQISDPPPGTIDDQPDWSPDGRRIAFQRCTDGTCSVWIAQADGSSPREADIRCTLQPICDIDSPSWVPNGTKLVVRVVQGGLREQGGMNQAEQVSIDVFDPRNGEQRTITERKHFTGDTTYPVISPDGNTIVYVRANSWLSKPVGQQAVYAVGFDGERERRLTPWALEAGDHPVFSPDGGTVLFRSLEHHDGEQSDFWTAKPDGSELAQLTHFDAGTLVLSASYSPEGEWVAHATNGVGGNADVVLMRADGTGSVPVTRTELWDSAPDWGVPPA